MELNSAIIFAQLDSCECYYSDLLFSPLRGEIKKTSHVIKSFFEQNDMFLVK